MNDTARRGFFARLGPWAHDHRKLVVGLWVAALILVNAVASSAGEFRDEFNLPDSESKTGFDILDAEFGGQGTGIVGNGASAPFCMEPDGGGKHAPPRLTRRYTCDAM